MTQAIFLSYASQDADAARRICEALRTAGMEVWFDQSELRGGDAWDASIRKQIKECALFVPMISASTNSRSEGYFRLEWKLAVDRSHLMADDQPFFLPVILDDSAEPTARVPDRFRERQWTRLKDESAIAAFATRVNKLLAGSGPSGINAPNTAPGGHSREGGNPSFGNTARDANEHHGSQTHLDSRLRGNDGTLGVAPAHDTPKRADEGFWVAVLPFKHRGGSADVEALAEGISEEIVTGLSRFSYLRVIARGTTLQLTSEATDVRAIGKELGARYVMEGNLRQAGATLRVSAQLVDATTGAHLWAETYDRPFKPEDIFALQDDLVPRIVSTVADPYGVLPRSMNEAVRNIPHARMTPYEATLRSFECYERFTPERHALVRDCLEQAVRKAPGNGTCWAMLSLTYANEHAFGCNVLPDSLDRALDAARRGVDLAPTSHIAHQAMAHILFFRKEYVAARSSVERALQLNPMDGSNIAEAGRIVALTGDWERGCAMIEQGMALNANHPSWFWMASAFNAYRKRDYRAALEAAVKTNVPLFINLRILIAASYGQLGDREAGGKALLKLHADKPGFVALANEWLEKWFDAEMIGHLFEGLNKAGLEKIAADAKPIALAANKEASIAVLAFVNRSASAEDEYFSDGLADELLNVLAKIKGLRVAARTSAFSFKGKQSTIAEIGRALNVATVLEGSVRKSGNRVRISVQLVKVDDGFQLWGETYDRTLDDIFAVQDDIAQSVVGGLRVALMGEVSGAAAADQVSAEVATASRGRSENSEAHRLMLQARYLVNRHTGPDVLHGLEFLRAALAIDPEYALAWAMLSRAVTFAWVWEWELRPLHEASAEALQAAQRAVQLEPELVEAHLGIAWHHLYAWDWPGADEAVRHALRIAPRNADALSAACILRFVMGGIEESQEYGRRAIEQDPLNSYTYVYLGRSLATMNQLADAEQAFRRALELSPDGASYRFVLAMCLQRAGRHDDALAEVQRESEDWARLCGLAILHYLGGRLEDADRALNELIATKADFSAYQIAEGFAVRGNADAAFEWLERAYRQRDSGLTAMKRSWIFEPIHADPRWTAFLKKMRLVS